MDVFRRPGAALSAALQPIGDLKDKLLIAKLRHEIRNLPLEQIWARPEQTTESYLADFGLSPGMIDSFFRSFYGGIFLERELQTTSRMFEFTFKMFAEGNATLPARGMQEIPRQLSARLDPDSLRLQTPVHSLHPGSIRLASGKSLDAGTIVVATDAATAHRLVPELPPPPAWRPVTCLHFAAGTSPLHEPILALDGSGTGLVNNVCVPSDVSPDYAPAGSALVSVSVLGTSPRDSLEADVRNELRDWFGPAVDTWRHLRTDRIPHALPEQRPGHRQTGFRAADETVFVCGDHCTTASIEGAITSGLRTAEAVQAVLSSSPAGGSRRRSG